MYYITYRCRACAAENLISEESEATIWYFYVIIDTKKLKII
jgi:hypothetical protein